MDGLLAELNDTLVFPAALLLLYITDETDIRPIIKGSLWFVFPAWSVRCVFICDSVSQKMFYAAYTCLFIFVACMILITNDNKKYERDVKWLIYHLFILMMFTGLGVLVMDYTNTEKQIRSMIILSFGALLGIVLLVIREVIKPKKPTEGDL